MYPDEIPVSASLRKTLVPDKSYAPSDRIRRLHNQTSSSQNEYFDHKQKRQVPTLQKSQTSPLPCCVRDTPPKPQTTIPDLPDAIIIAYTSQKSCFNCTESPRYPDTLQFIQHPIFSPKRVNPQQYFHFQLPDMPEFAGFHATSQNRIQVKSSEFPEFIDGSTHSFQIKKPSFAKSTALAQIPTDRPVINLPYFFDDPYYQIGAFYGKAVGMTYVQGPSHHPKAWRCTTWIAGGPFVFTNEHCYRNSLKITGFPEFPFPVRFAAFGLFGQTGSGNHDAGLQSIENRLIDLGIPPSDAKQSKYLPYDPGFTCRIVDDENNAYGDFRDIAYYQCEPLHITYSLSHNHIVIRLDRSGLDWVTDLGLGCAPL